MAKKAKAPTTKKRSVGTDIPLDNIPDRVVRQTYTDEFKMEAVKRVQAGESAEAVSQSMGIPGPSVISNWRSRVEQGLPVTNRPPRGPTKAREDNPADASGMLKAALARAIKARDERLEAAAMILENDIEGKEGAALAKNVRGHKRATH